MLALYCVMLVNPHICMYIVYFIKYLHSIFHSLGEQPNYQCTGLGLIPAQLLGQIADVAKLY